MNRIHQLVRQAQLGHALRGQLFALAVHGSIVVAEAPHADGFNRAHLLDQRLERPQRLGAGDRVRLEQPPVGRVVEVIDPRKLGQHGSRMTVG